MLVGDGPVCSDLKKQVQSALNTLINQTYIQKVGEQYEFLTDVEKDIEKFIDWDTAKKKLLDTVS